MKTPQEIRPLVLLGTRPEAIKLAPVLQEFGRRSKDIDPIVCFTGQHREMLAQVADYFGIKADIDLRLMQPNQTLDRLTSRCLVAITRVLDSYQPDCVMAQGDTTTVLAGSMAAFYRRIPFVHVEAGLRSGDLYHPWPEEFNRRVASITTALHCAPTDRAAKQLLSEGVTPSIVHVTGNTVIDALLWTRNRERDRNGKWERKYAFLKKDRAVLITGHRRENFGGGFENICSAIAHLSDEFRSVQFVYPVHLNPNVRVPVHRILSRRSNVHLLEPVPYPEFVWLMDRSFVILSDSGGVQEEAPSLRKPVLVMRETTERPEAAEAGAVELVGTDKDKIVKQVSLLLNVEHEYKRRQIEKNPYGDGRAAERIVNLMLSTGFRRQMLLCNRPLGRRGENRMH